MVLNAAGNAIEKKVLCSGEILFDFLSTTSGMGLGKSLTFEKRPGGSPFNIAVGLSRLGQKTGFLVKLGTDEFGRELKNLILSENIDPYFIVEGKGQNTTLAMVAIDASGKPEFRFYRDHAADVSLTWEELPQINPKDIALYHFGSVSLGEPPASETYSRLFQKMRQDGVLTVLDPNIRPLYLKDKPDFKKNLMQWIADVDVLKLSDDDLSWISGCTDVEEGLARLPLNPCGLTVVTEGAKGARALWRGKVMHVKGFRVPVEETTGCGDAFMSGLMFQLVPFSDELGVLDGESLKKALEFANACAAIVATRRGAANSMPYLDEVKTFIKTKQPERI